MYKRDEILKDLHTHIIEVTFTKVNGQQRVMRCTLDPQYLPSNYDKNYMEEQHKKKENLDVIVAWDIVSNGWRSFRIESVSYVQIINAD